MLIYKEDVSTPRRLKLASRDKVGVSLKTVTFTILAAVAAVTLRVFGLGSTLATSTIASELGPRLSPDASIILPSSEEFAEAILRWTEYRAPTFSAVVEVANEKDVQETMGISIIMGNLSDYLLYTRRQSARHPFPCNKWQTRRRCSTEQTCEMGFRYGTRTSIVLRSLLMARMPP